MKKLFLREADFTPERMQKGVAGIPEMFYEPKCYTSKNLMRRYSQEMDRDFTMKQSVTDELLFPYFREPSFMERVFNRKDKYVADYLKLYLQNEIAFTFMLDIQSRGVDNNPTDNLNIVCRVVTLSMKIIDRDINVTNRSIFELLKEVEVYPKWMSEVDHD